MPKVVFWMPKVIFSYPKYIFIKSIYKNKKRKPLFKFPFLINDYGKPLKATINIKNINNIIPKLKLILGYILSRELQFIIS